VLAIAAKDLRLLVRARASLFFTFVWPVLIAVGFGLLLGGGSNQQSTIAVAVADEDGSPASRAFVDRLATGGELDVVTMSRADALAAVRRGRRTASIIVKQGFGSASDRMFYGQPPEVELGIDPGRKAEAGMLEGVLMKHGAARLQGLFGDPAAGRESVARARQALPPAGTSGSADATLRLLGELDRFLTEGPPSKPTDERAASGSGGWQPLSIVKIGVTGERRGPRSTFDFTFPQGVLWGIIGCVMAFAVGLVVERTHGTLVRLQTAPLSRAQLLGGKALACYTAALVVQVLLYTIGMSVFGIQVPSIARLALAMVSIATAFVGLMMIVASLGRNEQATSAAGWAIMMPFTMIGGGMIPLFIMPAWLVRLSALSPVKWAILALEGATWRQFGWSEMLLPCGILLVVGLVAFTAGTRLFRTT
jgi:ABC-2 type transport system permease protein